MLTMPVHIRILLAILLCLGGAIRAGDMQNPISGPAYDRLIASQDLPLQQFLESLFPEENGFYVTGPLDPLFRGGPPGRDLYHSVRVVCADIEALDAALYTVEKNPEIFSSDIISHIHRACQQSPAGYRGIIAQIAFEGEVKPVQFHTPQQGRWLMWMHDMLEHPDRKIPSHALLAYVEGVSDYLYGVDRGWDDNELRSASDYGLSGLLDSLNFFRPSVNRDAYDPGDFEYTATYNPFASGLTPFAPAELLFESLADRAPSIAFPEKSPVALQHAYRDFLARGGDLRSIRTLTSAVFDALATGTYIFAVNAGGKVRFAPEIKKENGEQTPPVIHAFLFPGEALLTTGRFTIENDSSGVRLVQVDTYTGSHQPNADIGKDFASRSENRLPTLGHFFRALTGLQIAHDSIVIGEMRPGTRSSGTAAF